MLELSSACVSYTISVL